MGDFFLAALALAAALGWRAAFARSIVVLYVFNFAMQRIFP